MDTAQTKNSRLLLLSGGGYVMALQLGNPNFVLPWISTHLGATAILVVLIVPMVQVGRIVADLLIGPKLNALRFRKGVHTASLIGLAVTMMLAAFAAGVLPSALIGWAILVCAFGNGVCTGGYQVANQELLAKTISKEDRGRILAKRVALGGAVTIVIALAYQALAPGKGHNAVIALWVAVGAWALAAAVSGFVNEDPGTTSPQESVGAAVQNGLALLRQHQWFKSYLIGRVWLSSVELAIPFYAIHAATLHDPTAQNLSVFIVAMCLSLVLAGMLWGRWTSDYCHLVMAGGASLAVAAGLLTLVVDEIEGLQVPYFHSVVMMILVLGRQGVIQGRTYYLSVRAPASERPNYISISDGLLGIWSMIFVFFLGWAAHLHHILLPLTGLIGLNAIAAIYAGKYLKLGSDQEGR